MNQYLQVFNSLPYGCLHTKKKTRLIFKFIYSSGHLLHFGLYFKLVYSFRFLNHALYIRFLFKESISTIRNIKIFTFCLAKLLFLSENPWSLDQIFHLGSSSDNTDISQLLCGRILTNIVVAVAAIHNVRRY